MSGHSKWAQIKRKKAVTDAARGRLFTRMIKEIQIAARLGGPHPEGNPRLRFAIELAKKNSMPADNIKRAIARGAGLDGGAALEELTYEAYAPGGVAIMIETATDNRNRTVGEMRHILGKYGGSLGESGSVSWMFTKKGVISVPSAGQKEDDLLLLVIDAGADDLKSVDPEFFEISTASDQFENVRSALEQAGIPIEEAKLSQIPTNLIRVEGTDAERLVKLIEAIEENDDVQNVYSNADIDEKAMAG